MEGGANENLAKAKAHRQANAHCDQVAGGAPEFAWSWHRRVGHHSPRQRDGKEDCKLLQQIL
jgi:hypothetical protein